MYSLKEGAFLVKLARKAVENFFRTKKYLELPKNLPKKLLEPRGVFVSIKMDKELRGCIGFPLPIKPLALATIKSAISAAFEDPRFLPLKKEELDKIIFEVSILTEPKLIEVKEPKEYVKKIKIGKDGIIVEKGFSAGLLLPQVAIEENWDARKFLEHACLKAGLNKNDWQNKETKIFSFQAEIFREEKPKGKVIRIEF